MPKSSILIVDDEAIVRESLRDWLQEAGFSVTTAESGEQALKMVAERDFGVVVLDVRLPGQTGITVLKQLREVKPRIKSIIITAYPTVELAIEATKLGALDYLVKPVAPEDLEKLIRDAVEKGASE